MWYTLFLLDSTSIDAVYHNGGEKGLWSQITGKLCDIEQVT